MERRKILNSFLVDLFNDILKAEEKYILCSFRNVSLKEMHLIEAVCRRETEGSNSSAAIASDLRITAGTLTTAVSILEKKGYLFRQRDSADKRVIRLFSTDKGRKVNKIHSEFHNEIIEFLFARLSDHDTDTLISSLGCIRGFFKERYSNAETDRSETNNKIKVLKRVRQPVSK